MAVVNLGVNRNIHETTIPNLFIDNYMGKANPAFVVVYVYFFRHYQAGNTELSTNGAAEALNLLESDVVNAFKYWEKEGLISVEQTEDEGEVDFGIDFLPIVDKTRLKLVDGTGQEAKPVFLQERPQYSAMELEIYKSESKEINSLFYTAEKVMGKYLSFNDLSAIFGLYDWLRLPIDVIILLLSYCADNNHRSIRYIEKVAIDWAENGITTVEKANEYIKRFNVSYREILKAFGNSDRNPTAAEIKYMNKWLTEFEMPLQLILEACDKTILQTSKPRIQYTDKIICDWHAKGVKTLEQVRLLEEQFHKDTKATAEEKTAVVKKPVVKQNKFVNFKQREWDYDQIEQMERKFLEDSVSAK